LKGVFCFLHDIVNWNGRVVSFMELSELYGKVCSIQDGLQHNPKKWRQHVAVGGRELVCLPNIKDLRNKNNK
jgi:hypothetical protein